MLEINAKENTQIEVLKGDFPLGNRDKILVHFLDPLLIETIRNMLSGIGTCKPEDNYYTYGTFDKGIEDLILDLNENAVVNTVSGICQNYSNCLHCSATNGLGLVELKPDNNLMEIGKKYIFSCYIHVNSGECEITAKDNENNIIFDINKTNNFGWLFIKQEFIAKDTTFNLFLNIPSSGEFYIDNVMLFDSVNELIESRYDITTEIDILNPCNCLNKNENRICKVIDWIVDKETISVLLEFPAITVVDYQDNILCSLVIYQHLKKRIVTLGNTLYNADTICIYHSDNFVLNGYILPPDIDYNIDVDLTVGRI